jgi:hypothetical protein
MLAVDCGSSFEEYAGSLEALGSLEQMEEADFSRRLLENEVAHLARLEGSHGFAYGRFLGVCSRIVQKASWFGVGDLVAWFGDSFVAGNWTPLRAYENGLRYLVRLGLLAVERRDGRTVFTLPPNQRRPMLSLEKPEPDLPTGIPVRGARERLSLALERGRTVGLPALGEFLSMEEDYRAHVADPTAAAAVFHSRMARAEVEEAFEGPSSVARIRVADEIAASYDTHCASYPDGDVDASEAVALALVYKGVTLGQLGRSEDEIAVYDDVVLRFGVREEPALAEPVARALVGQALSLRALGREPDVHAVLLDVERRFAGRAEPELAHLVQMARSLRTRE